MSTTLKDILKKKQEQAERAARPEISWFSLKKKNPIRVQFLQELGDEARQYDSAKGSALYLVEHVSPFNFKKKALCSQDVEGRCFACEMDQEEPSRKRPDGSTEWHPWGQRSNMYIQLVTEDGEVQVLSRPAPGSVFDQLYEYANEENDDSIIGVTFKISKGAAKSDKWEVKSTKQVFEVPDSAEVIDLNQAIGYKLEYSKQRAFYMDDQVSDVPNEEAKDNKDQPENKKGWDW